MEEKNYCPYCGTELAHIDYDNGDCIYYCKNCEEQITRPCDVEEMKEKLQRIKDLENSKIDSDDIDNEVYILKQETEFFDLE